MSVLGEAARIFVTVGLNSDAASKGLSALGKEVDGFGSKMQAWQKTMGATFAGPMAAFGNIGDAIDGVKGVAGAVSGLASTLLGGAARNEQYKTSFEVLLGSVDAADAKLRELKQFANTTPFTLPGVVEASKMLEVMGGGALNTEANLRMVGDAASFAGQDIKDVAVYFGRLYDGMKNGTPLGEVNMRLGEMGIMSGESKRKIAALAESVTAGTITMEEAWKSAGGEFKRFAGQTEKQSQTLSGLWSTFTDTIDDGLATIGTKLLPKIKPALQQAIKLFEGLGAAGVYLIDNIETLAPIIIAVAVPAVVALASAVWGLAAGVIAATWPFVAIGVAIMAVLKVVEALFPGVDFLGIAIGIVGAIVESFTLELGKLGDALAFVASPLATLGDILFGTGQAADAAGEHIAQLPAAVDEGIGGSIETMRGRNGDMLIAANALASPISTETKKHTDKAEQSVASMTSTILTTIKEARSNLLSATTAYTDSFTRPVIIAAELVKNTQAQSDKDLLERLKSKNRAIRDIANAELAQLKADHLKLLVEQATYGDTATLQARLSALAQSKEWTKALAGATPEVRAAYDEWLKAQGAMSVAAISAAGKGGKLAGAAAGREFKENLPTPAAATSWGTNIGEAWGKGVAAAIRAAAAAAIGRAINAVAAVIKGLSPPKTGPLREVDTWGFNIGKAWVEGLTSAIEGSGRALSRSLVAPMAAMEMGAMPSGGGGGSVTVNIGSFYGTDENIRELSRELGEVVRYSTLRR